MGVMRFLISPSEFDLARREPCVAYLGGMDGRVFPTYVEIDGSLLICRRSISESARLHVAHPVPGFGRPVLSTTSLRERDEPYVLTVELARGRLAAVRDQLAAWQQAGMAVPDDAVEAMQRAGAEFRSAACCQADPEAASTAGDAALVAACQASERLTEAYVRQRLAVRRRRSSHLPVLLGCPLGSVRPGGAWEKSFEAAFTATTAAVEWRGVEMKQGEYEWTLPDEQVAFAERHRLVASAGPLLDFGADGLPAWLHQWGNDDHALQCFVSDFVETAVTRYAGRVRLWEVAARANTGSDIAFALDEEHRLALTARAVEVAKQTDDELQLSLRVEQPWGEYQAAGRHRLAPLQFVDALVRSGVGLTGVTLEIAFGYGADGSGYRDRFEISRLIDLWSSLGLPLTISLAAPSQSRRDPNAAAGVEVAESPWKAPWGEPAQAEWLGDVLPLVMAKPGVVGIEWAHYSDGMLHRFPHAGLVTPDGTAKPALERLTRFRQSYWQRNRDAG